MAEQCLPRWVDEDGIKWRKTRFGKWRLWECPAHRAVRKVRQRDRVLTQLASATIRLAAHHGSQPPWPLDGLSYRSRAQAPSVDAVDETVNEQESTIHAATYDAPDPTDVPETRLADVDMSEEHTVPTVDAVDTVSEPIVIVDLPTAESETIDEGRYATMVAFPPSFRPGSAYRGSDVHAVTHDDMADDALDTGDIVTVVEHPHTLAEQLAAARAIIAAMQTAHSATDNATTQTDLTGDALDERDSELAGAYRVQSALADELATARR